MARKAHWLPDGSAVLAVALAVGCSGVTPQMTAAADAGPTLNGCAGMDYTDRTAMTADRTVSFGTANGSPPFQFAPRCITIAAGQSVTFNGTFSSHPLSPGTGPGALAAGSPNNPIQRTGSGNPVSFMFAAPGLYPYFCEMHYAGGMMGVVQVR